MAGIRHVTKANVTCILSVTVLFYLFNISHTPVNLLCFVYELLMRMARDCFSTNNDATDAATVQWVEIIEPKTQQRMFANMKTGECLWDAPLDME